MRRRRRRRENVCNRLLSSLVVVAVNKTKKIGCLVGGRVFVTRFFFYFPFFVFWDWTKKDKKKKKMKRCVWLGAKICVNHLISDRHSVRLNNHPNHSSLLINLPDFVFFYVLVLIMLTALDPLNIDTLQFLPPPHF